MTPAPAPRIEDYRQQIEDALVYSARSHTYEDVAAMVARGDAQAWFGPRSIVITEILIEPQYKVLHFFLAGGHGGELEAMVPLIEQWGREHGCQHATLVGRKGWERTFLKRQGWEHHGLVVMEKNLNAEERR